MLADAEARYSNPNVKAQMSNEGILPVLYSIGPHPPFDIWILSFDILVETITTKYVTWFWDTNQWTPYEYPHTAPTGQIGHWPFYQGQRAR
jgi:hypothetical protein